MRLLRKLLSIVFALIAIPLLTAAACNFALQSAIFTRATYDAVLDDDVIFDELLSGLLPVVLDSIGSRTTFEGDNQIPLRIADVVNALQNKPDVRDTVTTTLLPPDTLQSTVTQLVDVFFAVTQGNIDQIEQEIDLSDLRQRFTGETATQIATLIITEAPRCTDEERDRLSSLISDDDAFLPICNPSDEITRNTSVMAVEAWLIDIGSELGDSDRVTVSEFLSVGRDEARFIALIADIIFNQALILFYLCPFAILSVIIIFSVRSLNDFGRWIGGVSIAVGLLILLVIIALQVLAFGTITGIISESTTAAELFLARLGSALLRSAISASSTSLLLQSALFIGGGFILMALAWYLGRDRDDEGSVVIITDDGEVISTATQQKIGSIASDEEDDV